MTSFVRKLASSAPIGENDAQLSPNTEHLPERIRDLIVLTAILELEDRHWKWPPGTGLDCERHGVQREIFAVRNRYDSAKVTF